MKPALNTWYYKETVYSEDSKRRTLYYFTVSKPKDYLFSCYYISKMIYPDGTSSMFIYDDYNAYGITSEGLIPCDNPEEIYKELIGDYNKFFKK